MAFDPDEYLKRKKAFDPDEYLGKPKIGRNGEPYSKGWFGDVQRAGDQYIGKPLDFIYKDILGLSASGPGGSPTPKEFVANIAKLAPFLARGGGALATMGINAASQYVGDQIEGKDLKKSASEAAIVGGISGAIPGIAKGIKAIGRKVKDPLSYGIASIGSFLSSVPEESYQRATDAALSGKSIFSKSPKQDEKELKALYSKMGEGLNFLNQKLGKEVKYQKNALKNSNDIPKFDSSVISKEIEALLDTAKASGGTSPYTSQEIKAIQNVKLSLMGLSEDEIKKLNEADRFVLLKSKTKDIPIDDANIIKNKINSGVYSNNGTTPIIDPKGPGEGALKFIANKIKDQVAEKAPDLNRINEDFAKIRDITSKISRKTSDFRTGPKTFKGAIKSDDELGELLSQASDYLPKEMKYAEPMKDLIARDYFRALTPGQGGGSGSSEGSANLMRTQAIAKLTEGLSRLGGIGAAATYLGPIAGATVAGSFSPVAHKIGIKAMGGAVKGANKALNILENNPVLSSLIGKAAVPKSNPNGSTNQDYLERIKRQRGIQ